MKKLFFIILLSHLHAYNPIELAQPLIEVGVIVHENVIGQSSIKAQINGFTKGFILGTISSTCGILEALLIEKKELDKNNYLLSYISNGIITIEMIKNVKDSCILSKALGLYMGKKLIHTFFFT